MAVITRRKRCPNCGEIDFTRKHRSFWMRWFKGSRLFQCRRCRTRILLLREALEPSEPSDADHSEYPDNEFDDAPGRYSQGSSDRRRID